MVGLQLDEHQGEIAEDLTAILATIKRNEFPPAFSNHYDNHALIAGEMMLLHFEHLFAYHSSKENLNGWHIKGQFLNELVTHYFNELNFKLLNFQHSKT